MRALPAAIVLLAAAGTASAAPVVHTDVREVAACLPVDGGVLAGTGGGLVLRSGGDTRVWTAVDGLPGTRVHALVVDGERTWVGTEGGAALVSTSARGLSVHRTVAGKPVRDLLRAGTRVYLATWGDGVRVAGSRALPMRGGDPARRARASALAEVDGVLWAGTAAGVYRLDGGALVQVPLVGEPEVASLHADGTSLWIATSAGLFRWDGRAMLALGGGDLRRVTRIGDDVVVAAMGGGLLRVDRGRLVPLDGAPRALVMAQAIAARDGAACAGGLDGLWTRTTAWAPAPLPAGLPSNDISALAADGSRLWVGTFDRGLAVLENGAWRMIADPDLDARINALAVDGDRVWAATAAGLTVIDGDRIHRIGRGDGLPSRNVLSLAVLRDSRLLVGTTQGAAIVGAGRPIVLGAKRGVTVGNVWAVAEDDAGGLWLGTTTGLYRVPATDDGAPWQRFSLATGALRDDWVMALAPRGSSMWVGTYKGGVTRFDRAADGAITSRPVADGWVNPSGLTWRDGTLFAATMDGLRIIEGSRPLSTASPGRDTTALVAAGDRLWIATRRGLVDAAPLVP